jgi:(p)ppGpp synthase/HD superfamily hydrolase
VTKSRGIAIHRQGCHNIENVPGDRLVPVSWNPVNTETRRPQTYPINIQLEVIDRVGVFKDVLSRLTDNNINVRHARVKTSFGKPAVIYLGIDIRDLAQLDQVFAQIKKMTDVLNLRRIGQADDK